MKTNNNFNEFATNVESAFAVKVCGIWLELSKFNDFKQFKQVALDLCHTRDNFKIEDYKGIPCQIVEYFTLANEFVFEQRFEDFQQYEMSDKLTQRAYEVYLQDIDELGTFEDFTTKYVGYFLGESDFAIKYVDEIGLLDGIDSSIAMYFDYNAYARDLFLNGDFTYCNGYVFSYN